MSKYKELKVTDGWIYYKTETHHKTKENVIHLALSSIPVVLGISDVLELKDVLDNWLNEEGEIH